MALIKCPECGRDISDKVKDCPNCGFPIAEEKEQTQKVEISSVNIKVNKNRRNKIIKVCSVLICFILLVVGGYSVHAKQVKMKAIHEYRDNINIILSDMLSSGSEAEKLMNLTSSVWSNSIFKKSSSETDKYTKPKGYFVSDFNTALKNLFEDSSIATKQKNIQSTRSEVEDTMKKLQNPPDEYKEIYGTIMDLYSSYEATIDLSLNPQGNIQSFNNSKTEKINKFTDQYKKLQAQLPNNTENS